MKRMRSNGYARAGGFSLLEVIAAIAVLAIAFAALMQVAGSAMSLTARANERTQAALRARSLLDSAFIMDPVREGSSDGRFDDTYRWQLNVSPFNLGDATVDNGGSRMYRHRVSARAAASRSRSAAENVAPECLVDDEILQVLAHVRGRLFEDRLAERLRQEFHDEIVGERRRGHEIESRPAKLPRHVGMPEEVPVLAEIFVDQIVRVARLQGVNPGLQRRHHLEHGRVARVTRRPQFFQQPRKRKVAVCDCRFVRVVNALQQITKCRLSGKIAAQDNRVVEFRNDVIQLQLRAI